MNEQPEPWSVGKCPQCHLPYGQHHPRCGYGRSPAPEEPLVAAPNPEQAPKAMDPDAMGFGPRIKTRREALGFTLRDVEAITEGGVSNAYLSQLENGKIKNPSARIVLKLCAAYAISHDDMLAWLGSPTRIIPPRICSTCGQALPRNAPLQEGLDYAIDRAAAALAREQGK